MDTVAAYWSEDGIGPALAGRREAVHAEDGCELSATVHAILARGATARNLSASADVDLYMGQGRACRGPERAVPCNVDGGCAGAGCAEWLCSWVPASRAPRQSAQGGGTTNTARELRHRRATRGPAQGTKKNDGSKARAHIALPIAIYYTLPDGYFPIHKITEPAALTRSIAVHTYDDRDRESVGRGVGNANGQMRCGAQHRCWGVPVTSTSTSARTSASTSPSSTSTVVGVARTHHEVITKSREWPRVEWPTNGGRTDHEGAAGGAAKGWLRDDSEHAVQADRGDPAPEGDGERQQARAADRSARMYAPSWKPRPQPRPPPLYHEQPSQSPPALPFLASAAASRPSSFPQRDKIEGRDLVAHRSSLAKSMRIRSTARPDSMASTCA